MRNELAHAWLTLQCQMIPGIQRAILVLGSISDTASTPTAAWPDSSLDSATLLEAGKIAMQKRVPVVQPGVRAGTSGTAEPLIVSCPLFKQEQLLGVVAMEVDALDEQQQKTLLQLLGWGSSWLQFLVDADDAPAIAARLATVVEITSRSLEHRPLQAAASAVVNHLSRLIASDRVSLGLRDGRRVRVHALSHTADLDRRSNLVRGIEAAMDEALDEGRPVACPAAATEEVSGMVAHERMVRDHGGSTCTVPLISHDHIIGAITLERHDGPVFDAATIDLCDAVAALIGPVFEMKRQQERPVLVKARDGAGDFFGRLLGRGHLWTKVILAGLAGLLIMLSLASGEYRINATAVLEGTRHRALVAPVDGYIDAAHARAGDLVKQGDLIAALDDRDLQLERRRWAGERDDMKKKHQRAIGSFDRAEAAVLDAQLGKARAQLALVEAQLERTHINAPFDGVIVSGDLSRSLGAPVERGQVLFELAPLNSYRVALQVEESDIGGVSPGQQGHLALSAMPGERLAFTVEDIIGVARTEEGENGFRVEAHLTQVSAQLRPGMQGVGKISVEQRALLWIWTHGLLDRIQLWLWSRLP